MALSHRVGILRNSILWEVRVKNGVAHMLKYLTADVAAGAINDGKGIQIVSKMGYA